MISHLSKRCGCGATFALLHLRDRTTACVACQRKQAVALQATRPVQQDLQAVAGKAMRYAPADSLATHLRGIDETVGYAVLEAWATPDPNCPRGVAHWRDGKWWAHPDSIASAEPDPNVVDGVRWDDGVDIISVGRWSLMAFPSTDKPGMFHWNVARGVALKPDAQGYEPTLLDARRAAVRAMREHEAGQAKREPEPRVPRLAWVREDGKSSEQWIAPIVPRGVRAAVFRSLTTRMWLWSVGDGISLLHDDIGGGERSQLEAQCKAEEAVAVLAMCRYAGRLDGYVRSGLRDWPRAGRKAIREHPFGLDRSARVKAAQSHASKLAERIAKAEERLRDWSLPQWSRP